MASCMTPFTVKNKLTNESQAVPCGRCPNCYKRRVSQWSFRLMQQEKISENAHFITLTYDTRNVPITKRGFLNLTKRDLQLFFKRLRKAGGERNRHLKYYAVGEYGGKSYRPHYHAIVFNMDINTLPLAWNLGTYHRGTVTGASIGYTLKYLSKPSRIPLHGNDDRQPEFALMSKGLGKNYLTKQVVNWHLKALTDRMYVNTQDGQKVSMPRYYKLKIYNENQQKAIGAQVRKKMLDKQYKAEQDNPTYHRDKFEADKAAFAIQAKNSTLNSKI